MTRFFSEYDGYDDNDDDCWVDDEHLYEDPPLYPLGKLAAMTVDELRVEYDHQCDRQGRLGDAEYINDRLVEETEMRCNLVVAELKRRGVTRLASDDVA